MFEQNVAWDVGRVVVQLQASVWQESPLDPLPIFTHLVQVQKAVFGQPSPIAICKHDAEISSVDQAMRFLAAAIHNPWIAVCTTTFIKALVLILRLRPVLAGTTVLVIGRRSAVPYHQKAHCLILCEWDWIEVGCYPIVFEVGILKVPCHRRTCETHRVLAVVGCTLKPSSTERIMHTRGWSWCWWWCRWRGRCWCRHWRRWSRRRTCIATLTRLTTVVTVLRKSREELSRLAVASVTAGSAIRHSAPRWHKTAFARVATIVTRLRQASEEFPGLAVSAVATGTTVCHSTPCWNGTTSALCMSITTGHTRSIKILSRITVSSVATGSTTCETA
mmetsp:Transcript_28888/g.76226  ORF Transcript_28888/g.76226 Transcript_28888/m.76226 type:complete len:333 (-) Transcript_28888:96-1094(-)